MREGVTYKPFDDCFDKIKTPKGVPSKDYLESGTYPVISQEEEFISGYNNDDSKLLHIPRPVVIFGDHSRVIKYVDFDFVLGADGVKVLLPKVECDAKYIYYFLKHFNVPSLGYSRHFKLLREAQIPVLPLSTQELIVRELDSISSVISAKKQQVLELDNLAQAIFLDTFGDPISNPKGWEVKKMSEVAEIGSGGTPSKQNLLYWENGDVPWIGSNMCQNCVIYQTDGKYITRDGLNNSSAKLLSKGTVLVALVGATIGKAALLETETSTNQNVAFIKPKDVCLPYYLYFHLMHLYDLFMNIGNGDFKMANLSFVRNLPVSLPPLSLQQAFAEKVQAIEEQKRLINQSIAEFESLLAQRMEFHFA